MVLLLLLASHLWDFGRETEGRNGFLPDGMRAFGILDFHIKG